MTIDFDCHQCGRSYRIPESFAGKKVACKECRAALRVPGGRGRKRESIDDYLEEDGDGEGEGDDFSSLLGSAVADSASASALPPRSGAGARVPVKKRRRSGWNPEINGASAGGFALRTFGMIITVIGFLVVLFIGQVMPAAVLGILFWFFVSFTLIRSGLDDEDKWVLTAAAMTTAYAIQMVLATIVQGEPAFLLDAFLIGVCSAVLLNWPGLITIGATITLNVLSIMFVSQQAGVTRVQAAVTTRFNTANILILVGAIFLCLGSRLRNRARDDD